MRSDKPFQHGLAGLTVLLGFFACAGFVFLLVLQLDWKELPGATAGLIGTLIGSVLSSSLGLAKDYVSWLFGSSAGSERKTELLAQAPAVPTEPAK